MTALRFLMFTFWNSYVLKQLRLETLTFSDVTFCDINVVWCYVLSQYPDTVVRRHYCHICHIKGEVNTEMRRQWQRWTLLFSASTVLLLMTMLLHAFILNVILYNRWHPWVLIQHVVGSTEWDWDNTTNPGIFVSSLLSFYLCVFPWTWDNDDAGLLLYSIYLAVIEVALIGAETTMTTLVIVVFVLTT